MDFKISAEDVHLLCYQRTQYVHLIGGAYHDEMRETYKTIVPHLPEKASRIIDIGAGMGGINVFLSRHYRDQKPEIVLIDKDGFEGKKIDYNVTGFGFYHSFDLAKKFLQNNGVENVRCLDARRPFPFDLNYADLVISLLSWGFHYPVSEYAEFVSSVTNRLIIDLRKGRDGDKELLAFFANGVKIAEGKKFERWVFWK